MTESEKVKKWFDSELSMRPEESLDSVECEEVKEICLNAIEEVQQYREIGTVKGYERAIQISIENYKLCGEYKAKLQEHESIGTVSEFRELKEKAKPKKTIEKQNPYSEKVGFNSDMLCPNCGAYVGYWMEGMGTEADQMKYCCDCGQHLANDLEDKEAR